MTNGRFLLHSWLASVLVMSLSLPATAADTATAATLQRSIASLDTTGCAVAGGTTIGASPLLSAFYERRGFQPAWSDPASVDDLLAVIDDAGQQGLDAAEYHPDAITKLRRGESDEARRAAELDLVATDAFVRLTLDIRHGKIPARRLHTKSAPLPPLASADPVADLQAAIDRGQIRALVDSLEPNTQFYQRLQHGLAAYRRLAAAGGWARIAAGPSLKPGASDARVPALRERLAVTGDIVDATRSGAGDVYDEALVTGVRAFQSRHGLAADGVLGAGTLAALNVPVANRIDQIRATLERSRWFLHDLPDRFVMVNVAGFRVLLIEDGQVAWRSRAIVGKPFTETPMFRAEMTYIVLNPTWTIPASIVRGEILPAIGRDPRYLAKKQIRNIDGKYVQAAGPNNPLGHIKLMLPNSHSVYLHDTPARSLFASTTRTFSHGCVRVENPVELAALALEDPAWSVESLEAAIATGVTRNVSLKNPLAVMVLYWSVTVNREGVVEFLPDIYRRDAPIIRDLAAATASGTCR